MSNLLEKLSKPLAIKDVDFRVQSISNKGFATILVYKDARVDMNRLDEVCGTDWQDKYELINGQLFCSIGIKINSEWVWRQDVGIESNTEKVKGQASDAFKRAGFRWGIGRELYDYPLIQMMLDPSEFTVTEYQGKKKAKATYNLKLKEWKWDAVFEGKTIKKLTAIDEKGRLRFDSTKQYNGAPSGSAQPAPSQPAQQPKPQKTQQNNAKKPLLTLSKMNGSDMSKHWINLVNKISAKAITNIAQIKAVYSLTPELESELNQIINNSNAA
tara:strand:- start:20157 stop:20969 length:813 start_codon:yes stop_codon:yes gene_type:complete